MSNSELLKLITSLESGSRPDLRDLSAWLASRNDISEDDWEKVQAALIKAYKFSGPEQLSQELKRPSFTRVTNYKDDFSPLLDEVSIGGWLRRFVEHTRNMEAPTAFHFASALTVLGASLRRRVFVDQGYYKIYPAMRTMLVGPSGTVKKSTASGYAVKVGRAAGCYNNLMNTGSGEALLSQLAKLCKMQGESTGLVYVSEMSTLINKSDYNISLVQLLTDLFDDADRKEKQTKSSGKEILDNIAVSCLLGTNEEFMVEALPPSALAGGMMSRFLTWYQEDTDREFPRPVLADVKEYDGLVGDLTRVGFVKGPAYTNPSADKWYEAWYRGRKNRRPVNERLAAFWQRMPDHLLRLGMLFSVSDNPDQRESVEITESHLIQAEGVLTWILKYLPRVYAYVDVTGYGKETQRIITFIRNRGGYVSGSELGRKMSGRMSARLLDEHLTTLTRQNIIERIKATPWESSEYGYRLVRKEEEL